MSATAITGCLAPTDKSGPDALIAHAMHWLPFANTFTKPAARDVSAA